jgi:hypothetical protein
VVMETRNEEHIADIRAKILASGYEILKESR